jgi:hypothetical protein
MDCGRDILVLIDRKTRKMLSEDWYYGKHRFGIGEWGYSRMVTNPDGSIKWVRLNPRWKELWYRLIDLKRTILHQYDDVEMWVCRECVLSEYGTTIQERSKNPSKRYEERLKVPKQRIYKKRKK